MTISEQPALYPHGEGPRRTAQSQRKSSLHRRIKGPCASLGQFFLCELTGSLLHPLLVSRHTVNHLVAGAGLQVRYDIAPTNHLLGGVQAKLLGQVHLYGPYANVLRMELRTAQLGGYPVAWHQDYVAQLSTEHALFSIGQYQLILSPQVEVFSTTLDYGTDANGERFTRWQGALRVELPF